MRLEKIKLTGFKSFVESTTIHLPTNLVAVVGPNGCGKSNVIDAVRWVMGEGSARLLRGESMADVIFNGARDRKPVTQASVELVFDNSDNKLDHKYANYTEIAVKRTVARDGVSNYYLNNVRCRRRDITELFMGTGLGPRSYSIIEQGMISRFIEAHPDDLRAFVEEAAGIAKYKERRREAETHIANAKENLARLNDVRDEVAKHLQHLQRQATAAEKYQTLQLEKHRLESELLALRWHAVEQKRLAQTAIIATAEVNSAAIQTEQQHLELSLDTQRNQHYEINDKFKTIHEHYYTLGTEIARIEQTLKFQQETVTNLQQELTQLTQDKINLEQKIQQKQIQFDTINTTIFNQELELARVTTQEEIHNNVLEQVETTMRLWQEQWNEFQQISMAPSQLAQLERLRINHLEQQIQDLEQRRNKFQLELTRINIEELHTHISNLETLKFQYQEQTTIEQERLNNLILNIQTLRQTQTTLFQQQHKVQTNFNSILHDCETFVISYNVLEQIEELKTLAANIQIIKQQLTTVNLNLEQNRAELENTEINKDEVQKLFSQAHKNLERILNELNVNYIQLHQYTQRYQAITEEINELAINIEQHNATIKEVRERLYVQLEKAEIVAQQRDELTAKKDQLRSELEQIKTNIKLTTEQIHQITATLETTKLNKISIINANERLQAQLEQNIKRENKVHELLLQTEIPRDDLTIKLDALLEQRLNVENELNITKTQLEMVETALRIGEQTRQHLEQKAKIHRETLEKARLIGQESSVQTRILEEQLIHGGYDPPALFATLPSTASAKDWEMELERCNTQLQHIGLVNLAAIDELNVEMERKTNLDAQYEDVYQGLIKLEEAIHKIDKDTKTRFQETFDKINDGLRNLFPRLFGGGQAYLELTKNDLLNAGVTVMAHPPGKRNSNIHLLSGGEKALTAVALVFAIFQLNPAPFCMLDEVDAPLDDVNVGRFCDLVRSMTNQVQFIFITHNKVTMELANQLIGVTMNEPGVSRLVTVDVNEAIKLATV